MGVHCTGSFDVFDFWEVSLITVNCGNHRAIAIFGWFCIFKTLNATEVSRVDRVNIDLNKTVRDTVE